MDEPIPSDHPDATLSVIVFKERMVMNQVIGVVLVIGGLLLLGLG